MYRISTTYSLPIIGFLHRFRKLLIYVAAAWKMNSLPYINAVYCIREINCTSMLLYLMVSEKSRENSVQECKYIKQSSLKRTSGESKTC